MRIHLRQAYALQVVAPKRAAQADANKRLEGANKKLTGIRAKVKELKDRVASLEDSLMKVNYLPPLPSPPPLSLHLWHYFQLQLLVTLSQTIRWPNNCYQQSAGAIAKATLLHRQLRTKTTP